ncbi:MAG: LysR family transcriptional regulator [Bdellovibrionales bacterium]|nr:LysR family transcriptional regulator [Bdellovibrionales bacterium]
MNLRELSFSDLELVMTLATLKTVRGAARERGLSPAQLSKTLRRVESRVGHSLFRRSAAGIALTPEGVVFRERAKKILDALPSLAQLEPGRRESPKQLTIGTTNLLSNYLLPDVVSGLAQEFPNTVCRLLDLPPDRILAFGTKGMIDFAVTWDRVNWTRTWKTREVGEIAYGLYGRKRHPLGTEAAPEQVREYPFILPMYVDQSQIRFGNDRCPLPVTKRIAGTQTSTASSALRLAGTSDQLIFVPSVAVTASEFGDSLREIRVPEWGAVKRPIYVSVAAARVQNAIFESLCRKIAAGLRGARREG